MSDIDINFTKPMTSSEAMKYGFIEPPTWNEVFNSQEYKNYRGLIQKILGTDIKNYTDKEIAGFALITNSFSHKLKDPYIQNASKIGLHYKSNNEDVEKYLSKEAIKDFRQPEFKKLDENLREDLEDFIFGDFNNTILSRRIENNQENVNKVINDFIDSTDNSINYEEARSTITSNNRFINNRIDQKLTNTKEAREAFDKAIEIDSDSSSLFNDIIKNNKITDENHRYNHGLLAFTASEGSTENTIESARKNLEFILENPKAQISATSDVFRLGDIGISGTAISHGRAGFDLATKPTINNERRSFLGLKKALRRHSGYDENIVSEFNPDTIWVKDNEWSKDNIKDIVDLAKEKNINKLQIIKSRSDISDYASISDHSSFILHETNINDISEDEFIKKWLEDEENPFIKKEPEELIDNFDPEGIESTELDNTDFIKFNSEDDFDPEGIESIELDNTDLTEFDPETLEPIEEPIENIDNSDPEGIESTELDNTDLIKFDEEDDFEPLENNFGEDDYDEFENNYDPEGIESTELDNTDFIKFNSEDDFDPEGIESIELDNTDLTEFDPETLEPIEEPIENIDNSDPEGIESTELDNTDLIKFDEEDDFEPLENNFGEDDYDEFENNYDPEGIESTELDNTDFIKFDSKTLEPINEETHKLKTLDISNKETVIRYHSSPENAIVSDISKLGNNFKIANSGKSGTWASELDPEYISKWIKYNPDWLSTDDNGKLTGYLSKLTYKNNASILHINDEDSLKKFMESFSDGKNVDWNSVAQKYDGVRIENDPFLVFDKFNIKTLDYYGNTDVIFNPNAIENIETYKANEYVDTLYNSNEKDFNPDNPEEDFDPLEDNLDEDDYDEFAEDDFIEEDFDPLEDNFGKNDYDEFAEDNLEENNLIEEDNHIEDFDLLEDNLGKDDYDEFKDDFDPLEDNFGEGKDYLTEQEAFDLYKDSNEFIETGIMPDEFYIVQGLDPEEQKEAIRQLNTLKKSKPVNEIAKETQISENTQITIEEAINRNTDIKPSIESLKEESQEILNDIKEEIPEKTQEIEQELTSAIENTDNLAHKTLSNSSKIALGVAAAVAVGSIAIAGAKKISEKDKKQEENTYNPQMKYQNYYYSNDFNENDSDIAYNITKYRYGHRNII